MDGQYKYKLFGLAIGSDLELPELPIDNSGAEADIRISNGAVALHGECRAGYFFDGAGVGFAVDGVARYWVDQGRTITIQPDANAPIRNIRLYLLGSAMGILLHQRGLLPLHASAVEVNGSAVAFMGPSGAGKSTLAAWFHDLGHRILADDVCVVHVDRGGAPIVSPGLARLRLWHDALAATGREEMRFERSFAGDEDYRKYDVPIAGEASGESIPLGAVYLLAHGHSLTVSALHAADAVEAIFANTYRGRFVCETGKGRPHWEACVQIARKVPIFRLERPWGLDQLADHIQRVLRQPSTAPLQG